jgi:large subunit ribosomal protein LP0
MAEEAGKYAKKAIYLQRVQKMLLEHTNILVISADNVGSNQMQKIRSKLRELQAYLVMGKNSMMRKAIRAAAQQNKAVGVLLDHIFENVGLIFCKGDTGAVSSLLKEQTVPAAAKGGAVAPIDVTVPKGMTDLEPGMTSFLQVLGIPSKITKSKIEILSDFPVCTAGQKVGASEATLLQKLNIKPFKYGLLMRQVYDNGEIFDAKVLDISQADILAKFSAGVSNVASISLAINYPTAASVPHSIIAGFKNVLAIAVETDYTFPQAEKVKAYLANPSAFAAAAAPAAAAGGKAAAPAKVEAKKEESADDDMGFSLFD